MTRRAKTSPELPPGRILLDTCILNHLYNEGEYIWDGGPMRETGRLQDDVEALRHIFLCDQRADFEKVISPISVAEIANIRDTRQRHELLGWVLSVLNHWLVMVDDRGLHAADGGDVRFRFKLAEPLQKLEARLIRIPDFRRDPLDRLLLIQYVMGNCQAFVTTDKGTIWRHREALGKLGILVLSPAEYWERLRPWASLWL